MSERGPRFERNFPVEKGESKYFCARLFLLGNYFGKLEK